MVWMVVSALFVIAFPTISSAMTSYTANTRPYIEGYDKSMLVYADFYPVDYVLHDAHRIHLYDDYIVTNRWQSGYIGSGGFVSGK
jgi:hypothetical protein